MINNRLQVAPLGEQVKLQGLYRWHGLFGATTDARLRTIQEAWAFGPPEVVQSVPEYRGRGGRPGFGVTADEVHKLWERDEAYKQWEVERNKPKAPPPRKARAPAKARAPVTEPVVPAIAPATAPAAATAPRKRADIKVPSPVLANPANVQAAAVPNEAVEPQPGTDDLLMFVALLGALD
jgi:hypothetical protein